MVYVITGDASYKVAWIAQESLLATDPVCWRAQKGGDSSQDCFDHFWWILYGLEFGNIALLDGLNLDLDWSIVYGLPLLSRCLRGGCGFLSRALTLASSIGCACSGRSHRGARSLLHGGGGATHWGCLHASAAANDFLHGDAFTKALERVITLQLG